MAGRVTHRRRATEEDRYAQIEEIAALREGSPMRYLKYWLFDIGLVLVVAGIVATQLVRPTETHVVSPPDSSPDSGVNAIQFFAEYTDHTFHSEWWHRTGGFNLCDRASQVEESQLTCYRTTAASG